MATTLPSSRLPSHQSTYLSPDQTLPNQPHQQTAQPRRSTDTEHRHLLSDDRSIAPSESASAYLSPTPGDETPGERTPRARSPAPGYQQQLPGPRRMTIGNPETSSIMTATTTDTTTASRPYRGFPSEEAYLDALRAWAEERMFLQSGDHSLIGYYGNKTMEEYAKDRPPELQGLGLRRKWKARRERKAGERERAKSLA